ncbi:Phage terminase, small subunit [Jannaschia seohaensis]|uniref:Phage terminase small subunit n=1 Tax=Jannaschia seohaensis TaxID=475081 RepID=A0A2Y9B1K9_9RHOB|nr:phage terminase small subunit [Jannaschia seohaensis]SSA50384.1 Phage terminase, small subunit [Jannaschia seohaensis]
MQQSPWIGIANKQFELMGRFMAELGMTPTARARLPEMTEDRSTEGATITRSTEVGLGTGKDRLGLPTIFATEPIARSGGVTEGKTRLGGLPAIKPAFRAMQAALYAD